jgi:signal transduction histidine kinase/DNA-binding response OmpR family regulator/ligand-binding sensor domain-containing protein
MVVRFKLWVLLFFFICVPFGASAAKFYNVNALFGTSLREVNSVCNDSKGFIWASSKAGVLRLTEDDYRIYHLPYENTNVISVKLVSSATTLIAYTNNGQIFKYNAVLDRFDLVADLGKVQNLEYILISNLIVDEDGNYWIATSKGAYRFRNGQVSLVLKSGSCRLALYNDNQLFIARDEGIWLCDVKTMTCSAVFENQAEMPQLVSALYYDKTDNKLWIGTMSSGLFLFDMGSKSLTSVLKSSFPHKPILDIEKNADMTVLVGIDGQGVWELNKTTKQVVNVFKESVDDPSSLKGNGVYDIFCDNNKRVWIATYSGGLSFFDQVTSLVNHVVHNANNNNSSLVNNDVNCVVEDRNGKLWFATNNGISCWDVNNNQWKRFYYDENDNVKVFLTLCEDDAGHIWAGSYSSGVYVLDETGRELAHYSSDDKGSPLANNFIFDIMKDQQGNMWIGGVNGLFVCYQASDKHFKTYSKEPISAFAELSADEILLGCSYGLLLFNKQSNTTSVMLFGVSVRDMLVLGNDIWICTGGDGLVKYNYKTKISEKFTTQAGLTSNFVNSIAYADNCLWIGTENGLCQLNPVANKIVTYSSIYPLSRASFNSAARYKLRSGQLAWGTNNGAVIFAPGALREIPSNGNVFFQDLSVSGRSVRDSSTYDLKVPIDSLESIELDYHQNTISLELLPLKTTAGAKFSWKLEGFDKQWSLPSDNRVATYTNIPTGNFVLMVRLYDNSLSRVVVERSLAISIVPPFWKRLWFWVLVYVVILGLLFLVLQYYIKSLKQKHTEEKVRFFTNTAHDIRTSLTLIKAPIEELNRETNLSEAGKHYLSIAIEQARRLSTVVTQLMDFQKVDIGKEHISFSMIDVVAFVSNRLAMFESVAKNKCVELSFSPAMPSYFTAIDEAKMERVVDNLVSNAIKYSHPKGKVTIDLQGDGKKWSLKIKDDGIGIGKSAQRRLFKEFYRAENAINARVVGSGIGLLLVKNYVAMHKGSVTCVSRENEGSIFQLEIPHVDSQTNAIANSRFAVSDTSMIPAYEVVDPNNGFEEEPQEPEMKVLIVEDNDDLLSFMQSTLSREFTVYSAANGKLALEIIDQQMPDLVVSDIMMPEMDGFELCQKLKSTYDTSHIPVVLLTALSEKTEQLKGLGLGADDYLTKPFDMNLLVQRIKSIIRNRVAVREKALRLGRISPSEPIVANELNDKFMKRMMDVAKANIANSEFNKDEFASAMNVSSSLLYKKIKSLTNLSPTDFIKVVRLEYSLELLRSRQYNVTEVSELCGFTSVGYFSTVFRKHFGKSPTEIID